MHINKTIVTADNKHMVYGYGRMKSQYNLIKPIAVKPKSVSIAEISGKGKRKEYMKAP